MAVMGEMNVIQGHWMMLWVEMEISTVAWESRDEGLRSTTDYILTGIR